MLGRIAAFTKRFAYRIDVAVLIATATLLVAAYVFLQTVDEVIEGEADAVDRAIVNFVKSIEAPKWFDEVMRDCTAFGGFFVLSLVTIAVGLYFKVKRLNHALILLLTSVAGAVVLGSLLKHIFRRDRPDIIEHGSYVMTYSFPSGHAMLSASVWLTLAVMLSRLERSPYLKAYFILLGLFITFVVGISRVWLGVHWPSDVLAGWALGTVWAVACWFLARYLQRRGKVEASIDEPMSPNANGPNAIEPIASPD
jgi:undecaprenyl-diphosphatase